jgi:small GTP-binding protein
MPANLPPPYLEAEKRYRMAKDPQEKVETLEEMMAIMPHHKGTDKLRAELRRRIARHSEEAERRPSQARRSAQFMIKKEGAAGQVALVGMPNAGKSQLVAFLTDASPEVANYPFTTQNPIPGMMKWQNIQIQLIDLPSVNNREAHPWLRVLLRNADLLMLVVDLGTDPLAQMESMLAELKMLRLRPVSDETENQAIFEQGLYPQKVLVVANKSDLPDALPKLELLRQKYGRFSIVVVSVETLTGLDEIKEAVFHSLEIVRVYTKTPGEKSDIEDPVVLKKGSTVTDVALTIHKDFALKLKYAQLWGSGKFDGQRVSRDHVVEDGDVLELHV